MAVFPLKLVFCTFRMLCVLATNLYSIPAYLIWMFMLWPIRFVFPKVYWKLEALLFKGLLAIIVTWLYTAGYQVYESGDDISSLYKESCLVICNHQSTADILVLMTALQGKGLVGGHVMWIMDSIFKFTHFGAVSLVREDFFIHQGKEGRIKEIQRLGAHLKNSFFLYFKKWLVLFPEGGFLRKRRDASIRYAEEHDLPILHHVTLPRTGAMNAIIEAIAGQRQIADSRIDKEIAEVSSNAQLEWVIDMTIAYPQGRPLDLQGVIFGYWPPCQVVVHYKAYPFVDIPSDLESLTKWLYDRYEEKENMLDHYYQLNRVPSSEFPRRCLPLRTDGLMQVDILHISLYHLFFIVSTYLHILYIYGPLLSLLF
ncbi:acyl-CoA:lysophosphatidylglycerol acyltransferase 1-like [Gigantopelta aegis]|uniref:acyl-CoA:lysophosphatidylglycerol acyltransferase 1-like n=1 Tax=Gigantopelta aegis TaxID=1735272 RepID=UPI001B88BADA|nr:acyl-CoA:lysophosphatidylglycerol acyltransferase 1-like [Gigantopelta aegis]